MSVTVTTSQISVGYLRNKTKQEIIDLFLLFVGQPNGLDSAWRDVRDFHEAFGHPISDSPTMMGLERAEARAKWKLEEVQEFLDATDVIGQADAMIDLIYFAVGSLVEIGVKPQRIFEIVQQANMSKLWPDGKPHLRPDGKVIKPEGWQAPEPLIAAEVARQMPTAPLTDAGSLGGVHRCCN